MVDASARAPGRRLRAVACLGTVAVTAVVLGAWSARWNSVGKSDALALLPDPDGGAAMVTYREPRGPSGSSASAGYAVDVPQGWRRERHGAGVQWRDPGADRTLRITPIGGDPVAGLRAAEYEAAASRDYPGYRLLRLEALPSAGPATAARPTGTRAVAAEWEFTWGTAERRTRVMHSRAAGYEFAFHAPDSQWTPAQRLYESILETFRTR